MGTLTYIILTIGFILITIYGFKKYRSWMKSIDELPEAKDNETVAPNIKKKSQPLIKSDDITGFFGTYKYIFNYAINQFKPWVSTIKKLTGKGEVKWEYKIVKGPNNSRMYLRQYTDRFGKSGKWNICSKSVYMEGTGKDIDELDDLQKKLEYEKIFGTPKGFPEVDNFWSDRMLDLTDGWYEANIKYKDRIVYPLAERWNPLNKKYQWHYSVHKEKTVSEIAWDREINDPYTGYAAPKSSISNTYYHTFHNDKPRIDWVGTNDTSVDRAYKQLQKYKDDKRSSDIKIIQSIKKRNS